MEQQDTVPSYSEQLAALLTERPGWTGQITYYGYHPYQHSRRETVAELFGPNGESATFALVAPDGRLALGRD